MFLPFDENSHPNPGKYINLDPGSELRSYLKPHIRKYRDLRSPSLLSVDSIQTEFAYEILTYDSVQDETLRVYMMYIHSHIPNALFNLYFERYADGSYSDPYVLMYHLDSTFAQQFNSGVSGFGQFEGILSKHEMHVMFGDIFRDPDCLQTLEACWKLIFGEPLDAEIDCNNDISNGTGGGDDRPPGTGGPLAQPDGWPEGEGEPDWRQCYKVVCGCEPRHEGGSGNPACNCEKPDAIVIDVDCLERISLTSGNGYDTGTRNDYTECVRFLIECGILIRPILPEDISILSPLDQLLIDLEFEYGSSTYFDIRDCLEENRAVQMRLHQLRNDLIDPCNPENTAEEMLHDAVAAGCGNGAGISEEEVFANLNAEQDYIIESQSFQNCEFAKCIYDAILSTNTPTNCSLVEPLFDANDFGVKLNRINSGVDFTRYNNTLNLAEIYLVADCSGASQSDISFASTIIHEFIHAEIMMTLFNLNLDPNNMQSFSEAWDNFQVQYMSNLKDVYNLNDIHHAVMLFAENAVDRIATILWEINDELLTKEHYYHLAWEGLRYLDNEFVDDEYGINSDYYDLYQELLSSDPNLSVGCD